MSDRQTSRAAQTALLLAASLVSCAESPSPAASAAPQTQAAAPSVAFEDLPTRRLEHERVPRPSAANPSLGSENAPVTIQIWSDFECPFCADAHAVLGPLLREQAGQSRLIWHDYPLPAHAHAWLAAQAAREAFAQGGARAFWAFHDAIYEGRAGDLTPRALQVMAERQGLDGTRFRAALEPGAHHAEIASDVALGDGLGVRATPSFLVNDYFFVGVAPLEVFRVIVARARSEVAAPSGQP